MDSARAKTKKTLPGIVIGSGPTTSDLIRMESEEVLQFNHVKLPHCTS